MKKRRKKKKDAHKIRLIKKSLIVILLFFLLVVIYFSRYGKIQDRNLTRTNNVDIFYLDLRCKCKDNSKCNNNSNNNNNGNKNNGSNNNQNSNNVDNNNSNNGNSNNNANNNTNNNNNNNSNNNSNNTNNNQNNNNGNNGHTNNHNDEPEPDIPTFDEEKDKEVFDKFYVSDQNGDYIYQQNLKIFVNPAFEYTNKIAPGSYNTYEFAVRNISDMDLDYHFEMYEISSYRINMKYRLRKNDVFIIGGENYWVYASELETEMNNLPISDSDTYSLDWKWFDDDVNDTIAGERMKDEYKLNIRFYIEESE